MQNIINKVTDFARKAHGDQQRKFAPEPYIVHPVRVMETCRQYTNDLTVLSAALLHDVLEDTSVTPDELETFLETVMSPAQVKQTLDLVIQLTDVYVKSNYPEWNRRKRRQKEAERLAGISSQGQTIKYADIIDNSLDIINAESDFAKKYLEECRAIVRGMQKGNKDLHEKAIQTVNECLQKLSN